MMIPRRQQMVKLMLNRAERIAGVEGGTMSDEGLGDNHLHPRLDDGHA